MPIKLTKDGRTILTGREYSEFRRDLFYRQRGCCIECGRVTIFNADIDSDFAFHVAHRGSRGMGGGIRDDVVGEKRGQVKGGMCGKCHRESHHQQ
jgi:hypothetical protein